MDFTEVIELGVATFRGMSDAEDDVLVARLEKLGLAPWLASRLVTWLPIAFGAQLLTGKLPEPEKVSVGGEARRLSDDPVYVACRERARRMARDEAQAIATRSAVVKVVDQVLTETGRWPTDGDFVLSVGALPARDEATTLTSPTEAFRSFLAAHGLDVSPARCEARVFPVVSAERFRVQVDYLFADQRLPRGVVIESFGGLGSTWAEALADTIRKFERGTLHVLIAGLVDEKACAEQISWETWADDAGPRRVCLGSLLVLYNPIPLELRLVLDGLRDLFRARPRDAHAHTFRIFTARDGERVLANEVLLDGETWPEALELLSRSPFPNSSPVWGARLFGVIAPPA